ncbi:IS21-like element helper ATPase IstB [Leptothermofonsia sichuanensis E412]|nr:IS21-like element helper ATPase IstB [Leptothermofonsia sichuanensis]QZZ20275.1 IS21-like element helper ATPase IstB [Leptothermofonsia sichuanensis E412]
MNPSTVEQLKALRLSGMLEAWSEQYTSSTYHDLGFDERFSLLVEREHHRRDQQRLQRRLKQAQLSTTAAVADIDFSVARGLVKSKFLELADGQWVQAHLNLIMVGPTGVGKTFLSSVLANRCCTLGQTVRYIRSADLIMELKLARADGSLPKLQRQFAAVNLLVLDDWLRDPLPLQEARDWLDLLDLRYRKASCLFATQLPVEDWHGQIADPTLADAILDRIVHDSLRLVLKGESMRKLTSKLHTHSQST